MVDTAGLDLCGLLCCLSILVTNFLYLQRGEHLTPVSSSRAYLLLGYFDMKCIRFGELLSGTLGCHPYCIPFLLMCQDYQCSLATSLCMLCIISYVCFSGMETISWLVLESSWITGKVMRYLKGWVITEIHLTCIQGPVELPLLLRRLGVWPWDLNGRFYRSIICQMSVSREFQLELACLGPKWWSDAFQSNESM